MRLAVLLSFGVVELKRPQTHTGHQQKRNVDNVFGLLLCFILIEEYVLGMNDEPSNMKHTLKRWRISSLLATVFKVLAVRMTFRGSERNLQNRAAVSARHSSIDEDTSPKTIQFWASAFQGL